MAFIDYYKILEVDKKASDKDIKKAYRKLARKYHPDLNPNDKVAEKKFKEINEANEVLSNPENRKKYDQYGKDWQHAEQFDKAKQQQQGSRRQGSYQSADDIFGDSGYSDFFESMFGGRTSGRSRQQIKFRGQDFNAELQLDLKDVYTTHKRTLTINGKNIRLTIPAGVKNGQVIKIKDHGGEGINGGPRGDLYIKFSITNLSNFRLDKNNLHKTVDLDLYTAILGGNITVDTFDGKVQLKVKPETQNDTKVKLKGKGFPVYKKEGTFGDLYITYRVQLPTNLSNTERKLFTELQKIRRS
ncbi:MAG: J domain-containing protein [Flavobacteriaceae bacterium]|nr:J domain-containing protein [Flavobacteriaceae bacterium]